MWHIRKMFLGATVFLVVTASAAMADTLQTKDGNVMQGRYLGGSENSVKFEVNGKVQLYHTNQILSILFTGSPAGGTIPSDPQGTESSAQDRAAYPVAVETLANSGTSQMNLGQRMRREMNRLRCLASAAESRIAMILPEWQPERLRTPRGR